MWLYHCDLFTHYKHLFLYHEGSSTLPCIINSMELVAMDQHHPQLPQISSQVMQPYVCLPQSSWGLNSPPFDSLQSIEPSGNKQQGTNNYPFSHESKGSPWALSSHTTRGVGGTCLLQWQLAPSACHPDNVMLSNATKRLVNLTKASQDSNRWDSLQDTALYDFQRAPFEGLSTFTTSGLLDRTVDYDMLRIERERALLCLWETITCFHPPDMKQSILNARCSVEGLIHQEIGEWLVFPDRVEKSVNILGSLY